MKFSTQTLIAALAAATLSGNAYAATIPHAGTGGAWETDASWTGGVAPANDLSTDVAQFFGGSIDLSTTRQVGGIDLSVAGATLTGVGSLEVGDLGTTGSNDLVINLPTVTLTGVDTALNYTGDITVAAGSTLVSQRNAIKLDTGANPTNTTITLDGGTVAASGDHLELTGRNIVLTANGGTIRHAHARNVFGLTDVVISGAAELTLANAVGASTSTAGRIQLQGINTYTGGTHITEGGQAWAYSDASFGAAGTTIRISDGGTYFAATNVDLGTREFVIESGSLPENARINTSNKTTTIGGAISGDGALDIVGTGTLVIASSGNTNSGGVNIIGTEVLDEFDNVIGYNAPTVRFGTGGSKLGTGTVTLDNQGRIWANNHADMSGATSIVIGSGGGILQHRHARNIFNLGGVVISGDGELTLANEGSDSTAGRIQMQGINTYTGGTNITTGGQAWIYTDESLGVAGTGVRISDGGTYFAAGNVNLGTRTLTIESGTAVENARINTSNKNTVVQGALEGDGALDVVGTGVLAIESTGNSHSGGINIMGTEVLDESDNVIGYNAPTVRTTGDSLGTGVVTLDNGGTLQNNDSVAVVGNDFTIGAGTGNLKAGWGQSLTLNGAISGSGDLNIVPDSGIAFLNGDGSYTGLLTVEDGATLGGSGSLDGDLTIDAGGLFAFSTTDTLDVAGTVTLDSTFGIDDLVGISSATPSGTYTLIGETVSDFSGIENFGASNAFDLGDGVEAYFQNGSLQVVVTGGLTSLVGDYNGDGFVSQADLDMVLLNWGDAVVPLGFVESNLDGGGPFDNLMSQNELDGVLLNWGNGTPPSVSAVPEPTGLVLLGLGSVALAGRRYRK